MTPQQPQQECRYVKIESCTECNNRCKMKDLYKPYGMIPVPSGHEISDFFGRWVCTESNDMEIKNYTGNFPKWCPLSRPHTSSTEAPEKEVLDLLKKKVAWGKEIDRNHLFDYHNIEKMIEEAELRIESLRTSTQEAIER